MSDSFAMSASMSMLCTNRPRIEGGRDVQYILYLFNAPDLMNQFYCTNLI